MGRKNRSMDKVILSLQDRGLKSVTLDQAVDASFSYAMGEIARDLREGEYEMLQARIPEFAKLLIIYQDYLSDEKREVVNMYCKALYHVRGDMRRQEWKIG